MLKLQRCARRVQVYRPEDLASATSPQGVQIGPIKPTLRIKVGAAPRTALTRSPHGERQVGRGYAAPGHDVVVTLPKATIRRPLNPMS